jgi:carbamoyltransferase
MPSAPRYVLGISAYYHDSAACLIEGTRIVAAAQEERFTRKRHDAAFPTLAIAYCLKEAGIDADALSAVVFYEKPFLKLERILATAIDTAPRGFAQFVRAVPLWLRERMWIPDLIRRELGTAAPRWYKPSRRVPWRGELLFVEHHQSHAASAFYPSPFERAAVLTVDGVGEWATTSMGRGNGSKLEVTREIHYPHSLGLLYSTFTYFTGFKVNSAEYKLMGLAPYGEPTYVRAIRDHLVEIKGDGSFALNLDYFGYTTGLKMSNGRMDALFGGPARRPEEPITKREVDLARSIQVVLEDALGALVRRLHADTGEERLCMAGGVALNCVANTRLLRDGPFKDIWVQPAAGDAGGAVGAALYAAHNFFELPRPSPGKDSMRAALLGPAFDNAEVDLFIRENGLAAEPLPPDRRADRIAELLEQGLVVGLFQGRMEFGPRALGSRSIIADPRSADMQSRLNLKIKQRESFRPFAPAVMREQVGRYYDIDRDSPYMLFTADLLPEHRRADGAGEAAAAHASGDYLAELKVVRSSLPAVTHVDYSARLQTVDAASNPGFYAILAAFHRRTGCPAVINTSFNVRGEPIVCTPRDAYVCFRSTEMDVLVLNDFLLRREGQPPVPPAWQRSFAPD